MTRPLLISAAVVLLLCWSTLVGAQQPEPAADPYLEAAVAALGEKDFELGLQLLQKAAGRSDDPRITYYTGFALEKLGRCQEARRRYEDAVFAGPPRFTQAANAALDGFTARCVPKDAPKPAQTDVADSRLPRRSNTLATVGWVLTTVGGLVLVGIPVKAAFDREVATQSEQYFEQVYECDVDFGKLAADCDEEAIRSNPQWETYDKRIRTAKQSNVWMAVIGSGLLIGGISAVIVGSKRPQIAVVPVRGGAAIVWSGRF